jgi:hypothetical protein
VNHVSYFPYYYSIATPAAKRAESSQLDAQINFLCNNEHKKALTCGPYHGLWASWAEHTLFTKIYAAPLLSFVQIWLT